MSDSKSGGQPDLDGVIAGGRFGESGAHRKRPGRRIYGGCRAYGPLRGLICFDRHQEVEQLR